MKTSVKAIGLSILVYVVSSATAHANLVTNGSFENSPPSRGCAAGATSLPGWTVSAGNVDIDSAIAGCGGVAAADGVYWVDLTGSFGRGAGRIHQDLATEAGAQYELSFYFRANDQFTYLAYPNDGATKAFEVWLDSALAGTFSRTVGVDPRASTWTLQSLVFTATGTTTRLAFWSLNGANGTVFGPMLDGVTVERMATVASVPEPGSLLLLLAGLGVLAHVRRRG
jgi:hypothetical protein